MHPATGPQQDRAFFAILEQTPELDWRDPRGKKHALLLVLMGLLMALCAGRDGDLSSIHRHMTNHFATLCEHLQRRAKQVISRAQLPRLLAHINQPQLAQLVQQHYGLNHGELLTEWLAVVEAIVLRGSIAKGQKRGEAMVSIVTQAEGTTAVVAQSHYNGSKESERPAIANLLRDSSLLNKKILLDALHFVPKLLEAIHEAKGTYLIGLKANQQHLYRQCWLQTVAFAARFAWEADSQRGHGRFDQRCYGCYDLSKVEFAGRWQQTGLRTLIVVSRLRRTLGGEVLSQTVSYYVSNQVVESESAGRALYEAIGGHWQIETMHYRRDRILAEDSFRSLSLGCQRVMSSLRTLVLSLLSTVKPTNMAAQLDLFTDKVQALIDFLRLKTVL